MGMVVGFERLADATSKAKRPVVRADHQGDPGLGELFGSKLTARRIGRPGNPGIESQGDQVSTLRSAKRDALFACPMQGFGEPHHWRQTDATGHEPSVGPFFLDGKRIAQRSEDAQCVRRSKRGHPTGRGAYDSINYIDLDGVVMTL